jgi:hypothetical protein
MPAAGLADRWGNQRLITLYVDHDMLVVHTQLAGHLL